MSEEKYKKYLVDFDPCHTWENNNAGLLLVEKVFKCEMSGCENISCLQPSSDDPTNILFEFRTSARLFQKVSFKNSHSFVDLDVK